MRTRAEIYSEMSNETTYDGEARMIQLMSLEVLLDIRDLLEMEIASEEADDKINGG